MPLIPTAPLPIPPQPPIPPPYSPRPGPSEVLVLPAGNEIDGTSTRATTPRTPQRLELELLDGAEESGEPMTAYPRKRLACHCIQKLIMFNCSLLSNILAKWCCIVKACYISCRSKSRPHICALGVPTAHGIFYYTSHLS